MNNSAIILSIVIIASVALAIFAFSREGFCNCAGLGWNTSKPTYYVYSPTKDVTNYGQKQNAQCMGSQPVTQSVKSVNLGWRTGMPYDYFEQSMKKKSSNWAAGADPSLPLTVSKNGGCPSKNGGYMQNYGSSYGSYGSSYGSGTDDFPCGDMVVASPGCTILSDAKACPSFSAAKASANDLGVGVL